MDYIGKTGDLLCRTESKLAEFASEASTNRDYETAARILATAQAIKRLAEQYGPVLGQVRSTVNGTPAAKVTTTDKPPASGLTARTKRRKSRLGEYPRFFKSGDRLVKVGWSKKDKAEYEHKCPRNVLSCLVSSFLSIRGNDKRFSMDEVLPLTDPTDGSELPTYQIYVALAWLKTLGLIEQHGRQGYSVRKGVNLSTKVEDAWNALP